MKICLQLLCSILTILLPFTLAEGQSYYWSNFAGKPGGAGFSDGAGSVARFNTPTAVAVDKSGNVYVADSLNHTIRKITSAGMVTTVAGSPGREGSFDGTGSSAGFKFPNDVALDAAGNLYVADTNNHIIRKINSAGAVTTLAGMPGSYGSKDGSGSAARFNQPTGLAVDGLGNIYVADRSNCTIRKITNAGMVTTVAGSAGKYGSVDGAGSSARFGSLTSVALDSAGNLYTADYDFHTIRKVTSAGLVTTFAGMAGVSGSVDGLGNEARFHLPYRVAVDRRGNLYVADSNNNTVRKITSAGVVTTFAGIAGNSGSADGAGSAVSFSGPLGVAVDDNENVYVADCYNQTIRKITSVGDVTTLAGSAGGSGNLDGAGGAAQFAYPNDVAVDAGGNIFVTDSANHTIRKITSAGLVTKLAGASGYYGSLDGTVGSALFKFPSGVAVDVAGNLYVADKGNHTIRKISSSGVVTTFAGLSGVSGSLNGAGSAARFNAPTGVAVDKSGNVYVADSSNHTIRKITSAGMVTTVAGSAGNYGSVDSIGSAARFTYPNDVAVDESGNVYVADTRNGTIRKITNAGVVTTMAGAAGNYGSVDGVGSAALFGAPTGLTVDGSLNVYVADSGSNTIRKIATNGAVMTIGGSPGVYGDVEGSGADAAFHSPYSIVASSEGILYVADANNHRISKGVIVLAATLSSPTATNITATGATLGGNVINDGGGKILERGVICSITTSNSEPIVGDFGVTKFISSNSTNIFTVTATGLLINTEYSYKAYAINSQGTSYTSVATFTTLETNAPVASITPGSIMTNPGGLATFTANIVSGIGPFTYRWRRNGTTITGATGSSYTISSAQQSHEGSYDCVITNSYGSFTTPASMLSVNDPVVIVTPPLSQAANVGQEVTLNVTATGTEPIEFQWRKNGTPLPGENAPSLVMVVDADSGGLYDAVITNPLGSVTSDAAALTVLIPPVISLHPSDQNVSAGSTALFSVTASGPGLTYQWRRNGVDLSKQTGAMLMISNVQKANEGVYDVLVKNSFGAMLSDPAWLTLPQPLGITEHPQDVTSSRGDTASFAVTATGQGTLTYQWNRDGKPIKDAKSSTLNVPVTDPTAAGAYTVTVSSGSLKVTSLPAYLRVPEAGLLIYKFTLTGNSFEGTSSSKIALSGLLVLDRLNQRGGIIRFGKNGKLDTFVTKVDDGISTDSTGPVTNSQTVVSKVVKAEETPEQETTMLWLRGTDGLITFSNTDKTMAPKTLSGFQMELSLAGNTEVTSLTLTATLDNAASLQARQAGETVEQTLNRLAAGLQQKGFIRE